MIFKLKFTKGHNSIKSDGGVMHIVRYCFIFEPSFVIASQRVSELQT